MKRLSSLCRHPARRLYLLVLTALLSLPAQAILDTNSNDLSDLWEKEFNNNQLFPSTFDPQDDPDGDGWINAQEAAAGTNPLQANPPDGIIRPDVVHIPATYFTSPEGTVLLTPEAFTITWPTLAGKQYVLSASPDLTPGSWLPIGPPLIAAGGTTSTPIPITQSDGSTPEKLFWRVATEDADTDTDGLTNTEEHALGLNPASPDSDLDGILDGADTTPLSNNAIADPDGHRMPASIGNGLVAWWDFQSTPSGAYPTNFTSRSGPPQSYLLGLTAGGQSELCFAGKGATNNSAMPTRADLGVLKAGSALIGSNELTLNYWIQLPEGHLNIPSGQQTGAIVTLLSYASNQISNPTHEWRTLRSASGGTRFVLQYFQNGVAHDKHASNWNVSSKIDDGKWHHLALNLGGGGGQTRMFLDGSQVGDPVTFTLSIPSSAATSNGYMLVGGYNRIPLPSGTIALPTSEFKGKLDSLMVHKRLLTVTEIEAIYERDRDSDTLPDHLEVRSILWRDIDHNRIASANEYTYSANPDIWQSPTTDSDQDGLSNTDEQTYGTDPFDPDTDGDLMDDAWEVANGLNPLNPADALLDNDTGGADGLTNLDEYRHNTDPKKRDTDGDGTTDGPEAKGSDGNLDTDNGSDPADAGDNGTRRPAEQLVTFDLGVGDRSGSHSEDYVLNVYRIDPVSGTEARVYTLRSGGFGQYATRTRAFRKGDTYSFQIQWMGTSNATGSSALDSADWDYHMVVSPQGTDHGGILIDSYDPANQMVDAAAPILDPQDTTPESDDDDNITDFPNTIQKKRIVFLTIDMDADSDNTNDSALPDRSLVEDQQENPATPDTSHLGKVLWVNHGDVDADGIPGYGDGIRGVTPPSPASITNPAIVPDSRPFIPVLMEIPRSGIGSAAVFKLEYSGSNPAEAFTTFDSENQGTTQLAAGTLRVWTKDGGISETLRDPRHVSQEGDWIAPNTSFNVSELGDPILGNKHLFYVEAIRPSQTIAGEKLSLWVDPDGEGGYMGWMKADTVAFTNMDFVLNEAGAGGGLTRIFEPKPSTPRPKITATITAANLRADTTGERILADLIVTGSVTGGGADFMENGRIDEITLRVNTDDTNGDTTPDPVYEIPVTGTKSTTGNFNAPFPFSGTFSHVVVTGVPVQEGLNNLRLAAADPFSLADGYANYQLRVMAIQNGIPGAVLSSVTLQFTSALNSAAIDQITYSWNSSTEGSLAATILTETGPGTRIFTNPTAVPNLAVSVLDPLPLLNPSQPDTLDAVQVIDPARFTSARIYQFLKEVDPQTGSPANNSLRFSGSIHESDEDSAAADGYTGDSFTAGATAEIENSGTAPVVPMVVEIQGPEAVLAATSTLQAFGSPGNVAMHFGQKVRDGARYIVTAADVQRTASTFVANELRDLGNRLNSFIEADKEAKKVQLQETLTAPVAFHLGMIHGSAAGGWEMASGTVKTVYSIGKYGFVTEGEDLLRLFEGGREMIRWRDGVNQQILTTAAFAKNTLLPILVKIKNDGSDLALAMLISDYDEIVRLAEQDALLFVYMAELMPELWKSWENLTAYDQGYYTGVATFEIATLVISWTKVGKIGQAGKIASLGSKADFLTELRAIRFFNSGPGKQATDKLFELGGFVERLATTKMCFPAGTPVLTDSGPQAIETLVPDTLVWSRDPETGTTAWKPVLNTFTTHPDRFHHLRYRRDSANADDPDGSISTTGQHPFWIVQLQDFLPAKDLQPGHTLLLADGGTATVTDHTADAPAAIPLTAYNIEVADFHTYYAGEDFIHVHNAGRECDIIFSIYEGFTKRKGLTTEQSWKEIARLYDGQFGTKAKKMTDRALGTALDDAIRRDVFPGRNMPLWTTDGRVPEENMYGHFQKHVLRERDMAPFVDNPVGYIKRAHMYGDMTASTPAVHVYEGTLQRYAGAVTERWIFNRTTNEFTIRVLSGSEAGAMRSLHVRTGGEAWFLGIVNTKGLSVR